MIGSKNNQTGQSLPLDKPRHIHDNTKTAVEKNITNIPDIIEKLEKVLL